MKNLLITCALALLCAVPSFAQRIAVLDFNAGVGVSQADVDGISAIFNTYFSPRGYTLVERTQIDRVIDEQNFQRGRITQTQMVRIGQILNVSKVVLGDVNMVMGQYNVDVRVVDVESGAITAKDGATWNPGSSYRTMMSNLATRLASKIAIIQKTTQQSEIKHSVVRSRQSVETLYGYLKIFPKELGVFHSVPQSVIRQINAQGQYDYNSWRIPTEEELSLLRANGYASTEKYLTSGSPSGIVLLVTDKMSISDTNAAEANRVAQQQQTIENNYQKGLGRNGVYQIGDYYNRNGLEGVVFWVDNTGKHGKIVSLQGTFPKTMFEAKGFLMKNKPTNTSDGKANKSRYMQENNWRVEFPALVWCCDLGNEWYLPARDELVYMFNHLDEILPMITQHGGKTDFTVWHISSTAAAANINNSNIWIVHRELAPRITNGSSAQYAVRAVAAF